MRKILKIAQREYIETVKTKAFIFGILMLPVMVGLIIFFIRRMSPEKAGPQPPVKVTINDLSYKLVDEIKASFEKHNQKNPKRQIQFHQFETQQDADTLDEQARNKLRQGQMDVYVVLDKDILDGPGKIHLYIYKQKASNIDTLSTIENICYNEIVNQRYKMQNLSQELLKQLRNVPIEQVEIGPAEGKDRVQTKTDTVIKMMIPFAFMYLMFLGIFISGQQIISSVIEEKNSRIIEVLLSAVSPFELMAGKILGLACTGLTLVTLWASAAFLTASSQDINIEITTQFVIYFAIYYILGFLLVSSILAGAGSVCNTIKEAQSMMMPMTILFVIPLISWFKLAKEPNGLMSRIFSFIPPLTPMVMVLRISADSEIWIGEIIASIIFLIVSVLIAIWAAAKIFRTGILMYGKRLGIREICRCLLQS